MTAATLIDAIRESMAPSLRGPDGAEPPAALLWTDPDGQWRPLIPALMKALPELYELGDYAPAERRGPVIWLKCIVERTLPDAVPEAGATPVLYLPEVGLQTLRAADDCDAMLQPLVELQYRGAVWHQCNGRDWTVEAFLVSNDALGLDVARDAATRSAALRALPLLAAESVAALRGRRLEAEDFDRLSVGDPIRDLLTWMSDAEAFEAKSDPNTWMTFRDVCRREFAFDLETDGLRAAAEALASEGGKWNDVWRRFSDAPQLYPGIPAALRGVRHRDLLHSTDPSRQLDLNKDREDGLREALREAAGLPHADACERVAALDDEHRERRAWVWARIGESPYALALEPLGCLARAARREVDASSAEALAADYAAEGWRCDRAAIEALACLKPGALNDPVRNVVRALYEPWLDRAARRFQERLTAMDDPGKCASGVDAEADTCILFVDGLRFDLGAMLGERLEARGVRVRLGHRIAPIPTVTATAKPLASPAHTACAGAASAEDFLPAVSGGGKPANAVQLRALMARQGIAILEANEMAMALDRGAGAWMETGEIDKLGHSLDSGLARQIDSEIDAVADRVDALLAAGWRRARVVTDHGWLLLAGGLPKVDLPPSLVETKWARCAAVRGESEPDVPTYPWYWDPLRRIASPPGIGAFRAGTEYAHGGVSLQECVVPDLIAERETTGAAARITSVDWRGMRCRVAIETGAQGVRVDLRLNRKQRDSSIVETVRAVDDAGGASLVVPDDEHEGAAALVVVLDEAGRVLDDRPTTVGGE